MKTSTLIFTLLMIAQGMAYGQLSFDSEEEVFKSQLINGLKQNDANALMALFPTVEGLYALMDVNAGFYSTRLNDAKAALMKNYENNILPEARLAFQHLLTQGKAKGIDWPAIDSMDVIHSGQLLDTGRVHLRFNANGMAFNMEVKLFTDVSGHFKLTQFIKFI